MDKLLYFSPPRACASASLASIYRQRWHHQYPGSLVAGCILVPPLIAEHCWSVKGQERVVLDGISLCNVMHSSLVSCAGLLTQGRKKQRSLQTLSLLKADGGPKANANVDVAVSNHQRGHLARHTEPGVPNWHHRQGAQTHVAVVSKDSVSHSPTEFTQGALFKLVSSGRSCAQGNPCPVLQLDMWAHD